MIQMSVRGDGGEGFGKHACRRMSEVCEPHTRVDDEVAIPALHMPHIALHDPDDMRLPNAGDAITEPLKLEPMAGYGKLHRPIVNINLGAGECSQMVYIGAKAHLQGAGRGADQCAAAASQITAPRVTPCFPDAIGAVRALAAASAQPLQKTSSETENVRLGFRPVAATGVWSERGSPGAQQGASDTRRDKSPGDWVARSQWLALGTNSMR
jgi:hypothetical protein